MKVTLTFDNGPDPTGTTRFVLDCLRDRKLPSTFFITGQNLQIPSALALAQRAHDEGHWIGNHTQTHSVMFGESRDPNDVLYEIGEAQRRIGALATPDKLFRPFGGGGELDRRLLSAAAVRYLVEHRFSCVLWNSVPKDWEGKPEWVSRCMRDVETSEWSVVVLHDLPTGGMDYLSVFLDSLEAVGAEITQDFPPNCVPIRRGEIVGPLNHLMPVGLA